MKIIKFGSVIILCVMVDRVPFFSKELHFKFENH